MTKDGPSLNIKDVLKSLDGSYLLPLFMFIILLAIGEFRMNLLWYHKVIFSIIAVIVTAYHIHGTEYLRDTIVRKLKNNNKDDQVEINSNNFENSSD